MPGPSFLGATETFKIDFNGDHYVLNGKVGIGTAGPAEALHLYAPSGSIRELIETAAVDASEVWLDLNKGSLCWLRQHSVSDWFHIGVGGRAQS